MRKTIVQIAIGVAVVVVLEAALAAAVSPPGRLDFDALGLMLIVTAAFILGGSFLALLGPTTHASSLSIGPMTRMGRSGQGLPGGGLTSGSQGVLLSSGTRSLWDFSRSPGLRAAPSKALVSIGIGGLLFVIGLLLVLI